MVAIGFLRWLLDYQRDEIKSLLEGRGINISTGEISNLSEEFLLRFYVLHKKHTLQIKKIFKKKGYILHLVGSAGSGDEIIFTARDGITGFTIDSCMMPSRSRESIIPFLELIRIEYNGPIAVVRDMSDEITASVLDVFPGVPQQVCQYSFVSNLGEIFLKDRYETFRKVILNTNILPKIVNLKQSCKIKISTSDKLIMVERYWVLLAIEYVLFPGKRKLDYPFTLPYLEIFDRLMEVSRMVEKIVMWNAWHNKGFMPVLKFQEYLKIFAADTREVKNLYNEIKCIWKWLQEIRKVLGISREFNGKKQNNLQTYSNEIRPKFCETIRKFREENRSICGEFKEISKKISDNCQSHSDELFVKVIDLNGKEIKIIRHNGFEELNHLRSGMHIRRRTKRSRTTKEMEKYGALFAVLSNIECKDYIETVLSDVFDFVREMQNMTDADVLEARRLIRTFPQSKSDSGF